LFGLNYDRVDGAGTLLFDEIEKAHERVLDLFLQLLSAARITLGSGRVLNLEGFYVAATSNIGSPLLIGSKTNVRETLVRRVLQEAQNQMRPEIFDRFDRVLVFNRLSYEVQIDVGRLHLSREIEAHELLDATANLQAHPTLQPYLNKPPLQQRKSAKLG